MKMKFGFICLLSVLQVLHATNIDTNLKLGKGGYLVNDWSSCPAGESCYQASREPSQKFQYPIQITAKVVPEQRYRFSYSHEMRGKHKATFFVFYKDRDKAYIRDASGSIHTDKFKLSATKHSDKNSFVFAPPLGSRYALVYLRMEGDERFTLYMGKEYSLQKIKTSPELVWEAEVDPKTHLLTGTVRVKHGRRYTNAVVFLRSPSKNISYSTRVDESFQINLQDYFLDNEEITVEVVSGNLRTSQKFINYNTAPYTNTLGILKTFELPPKPWKALSWEPQKRLIKTWNHEIRVNDFLEITEVKLVNLNKMSLFVQGGSPKLLLNGKDIMYTLDAGKIVTVLESPNKIILKNKFNSAGVEAEITMEINYDGLVVYDIVLEPKRKINTFQLRYKQYNATWQMYNDGSWKHYKLRKIRKKKQLSTQRFYPFVWNGNQEYGIYWMAEKLYPSINPSRIWHRSSGEEGTQIELITKSLKHRVHLRFALGFTPSKQEKKSDETDSLVFRTKGLSNFDMIWSTPETSRYFGFPKRARGLNLSSKKNKKTKILSYYQAATYCMDSIPEWGYYQKVWKNLPTHTYDFSKTFHAKARRVDLSQKSWQDFYLANLKGLLERNRALNGLYFDVMQLHLSKRGDAYIYPVFDMRKFFERIYVMQKQMNQDAWFFLHSSPSMFGVGSPFGDILMSGEEFHTKMKRHRFYLEAMSIDTFSMQFATRSGAKRMFLAQYGKEKGVKQDIPRAIHAVGLSMLHDILLYPTYLNSETAYNMQSKKIDFFGKNAYDFVPYWELDDGLSTPVKTSSYIQRGSKRVFLVVFNTTDKKRNFTLPMIPQGYRVSVYDPLDNSTKQQKKTFVLEPYMCKLVAIEPNK